MNPKAITKVALYGHLDSTTLEWTGVPGIGSGQNRFYSANE
jgi:hypothetical protein